MMRGRRGLVMGVANDHSIAWGIARALAAEGAEIAFTYQGDAQAKRLKPLASSIGARLILPGDVEDEAQLDETFATIKSQWGRLDFLVHAIAHSDKNELKGRYVDTSRANFVRSLVISCYSFTAVAQRAAQLMTPPSRGGKGGALLTLTYLGAERVTPNYNVMGVAKAGARGQRALSRRRPRPRRTSASTRFRPVPCGRSRAPSSAKSRVVFKWNKAHAPLKKSVEMEHVGNAALYLLSDMSAGVTGEIHFVDAGFNIVGMPPSADLKGWIAPGDEAEGERADARVEA